MGAVMTTDPTHNEIVEREFARQAPTFAQAGSFFGAGELGDWVGAQLPLTDGDLVLDVCGGAGHLSRHLSSWAREFIVIDLTPEQLRTGREAVARDGIANVSFVQGDASAMPFAEDEFDLAMSRFAFHHLPDQGAVLGEMARVVRPGGHLAVIDMVSGGARHDELEILRDPSHTRAFTEPELDEMLASVGGEVVARDRRIQPMPVEPWLAQAGTPQPEADEIRAALAAEADGGRATGLAGHRSADGALCLEHRWLIAVARLGDSG
jgi:ubiquinone/menaquinone biosynthesis C-methylase UbiE